jgi:hypothetical protein
VRHGRLWEPGQSAALSPTGKTSAAQLTLDEVGSTITSTRRDIAELFQRDVDDVCAMFPELERGLWSGFAPASRSRNLVG